MTSVGQSAGSKKFQTGHKKDKYTKKFRICVPTNPMLSLEKTGFYSTHCTTSVWRLSKAAHEQTRLQPLVHLAVFSTSILPRRPGSLVTPITHYFRTPQYFQTHQKFRRDLLYTLHTYGFRVGSLKSSFLSHFVLCSTFFSTSCGRTLRSRVPIASS